MQNIMGTYGYTDDSYAVVVIGAGGAYLGAKAGVALLGRQDRMQRGTRVLFTGDNYSA